MSGFSTYPFGNFMMNRNTSLEEIKAMFDIPGRKGDTIIGNDVWIGMEAVLMPGVTVGDGAIISARSVVVGDVAPYTIVGGNPAKPLKQRFDDETVRDLQEIAWWNWPVDKIEENIGAITGADLDALRRVALG